MKLIYEGLNTYPPQKYMCHLLLLRFASLSLAIHFFIINITPTSFFQPSTPFSHFSQESPAGGGYLRSSLKMMQSANSSKTAAILARYKPIAPRPPAQIINLENNSNSQPSPEKIRESGYFRGTDWSQLQTSGPIRGRKRGRTCQVPLIPPSIKRSRSSFHLSHASLSPFQPFSQSPTTLSLPHFVPPTAVSSPAAAALKDLMELNNQANYNVPVEKDLLQQLQAPFPTPTITTNTTATATSSATATTVIKPEAIKLVASSIIVRPQSMISNPAATMVHVLKKGAEEIEREVESQTLPIVISDSKNKIRYANSAYKKLVGQPECCWIDGIGCGGGSCNRICGEVELLIPESGVHHMVLSNGFFCLVVIEWEHSEKRSIKSSIRTSGEAVRLFCETRDYMFAWRFHTQGLAHTPASKF